MNKKAKTNLLNSLKVGARPPYHVSLFWEERGHWELSQCDLTVINGFCQAYVISKFQSTSLTTTHPKAKLLGQLGNVIVTFSKARSLENAD